MAACKDFSRSVVGGSDEVKDILCEPCEQDGRRTEATSYCVDCSEYLCGQCYRNHKLFKAFRNHVLQDKSNMPHTVTGINVKDSCLTKCDLHSDKVIEYLCRSCDRLGCTTCITLDHRQCEKVEHIPKIVKAPNISQDFQIILQKVDILSQQVQDKKSTLKSMSGTTDNMRKMAKKELNNQRAEINKFFDELEKEMDKKIDEMHISNTAVVTAASKTYDTINEDLADFKTKITTKQKAGQHSEAYITMKLSVTDIDAVERKCQNMEAGSKILKYKLLPSSQVKDMKKNVTEICRLETETLFLDQSVTQATGKQQLQITKFPAKIQDTTKKTTKRPDLSTLKSPRLNTEINVRTTNDKTCPYVIGVTMIHEHYIVVADDNNSIKVIDIRNKKVTSEIITGEKMWNVTTVEKCKIAATFTHKIQFLTVSKSGLLSKDYTIDTDLA
ncbi:uncharacterized protein LOC123545453 [Mercenaria mercenaria]|uniref:uncharacterized protein LOC123545453 n=1 Tax=Mercenaria mercenaria TaxID=6596 RepID=UPI00234F3BA4|nr:uncharacterized protein LOC123545453 [Mercenaria mercenaria]